MLKYEKVANQIELFIKENDLNQGDKLPILDDLTEEFKVSKSTIIKALDILEIKGLIYQVRGSGIFVRKSHRSGYINLSGGDGFRKDLEGFELDSKVISLEQMVPPKKVALGLKLEDNEEVYYLKRLRIIEGAPLCLEESYFSKKHVIYLNNEIVQGSVFDYLRDDLKIEFGFTDIYLRIVDLSKKEAELMGLKEGDAALLSESMYHLHNGEPFNYSILKYHKDQAQFFVPTSRY